MSRRNQTWAEFVWGWEYGGTLSYKQAAKEGLTFEIEENDRPPFYTGSTGHVLYIGKNWLRKHLNEKQYVQYVADMLTR